MYFGSFSPRKYSPRSCTHPLHAAGPIRFGRVNTGSSFCRISTGTLSSATRSPVTRAGNGPYCCWLNSVLLYCTSTVPPRSAYSSSRRLYARRSPRRSYPRTPLTITSYRHARAGPLVPGRTPPRQLVGLDEADLRAKLLDGRWHLIADADDVADVQAGGGLDIDHLD